MISDSDTIKGIFLLILAVSGNFVAETLGCKTQKLLSEDMFAKHIIIYLIIYFALGFTSNNHVHPGELAKYSLLIWILFVLFSKMTLPFTIVTFILLAFMYIIHSFIDYYKHQGEEKHKNDIENFQMIEKYTKSTVILMVIIGFILYFMKQYKEYYKTWSTFKFIFGVNKCKSLS